MVHTPGPWTAHPDEGINGGPWIEAAKAHTRVHIAHVSNGNEANARLIAAAPEMLEALKDAQRHCGVIPLAVLHRLIAKVEVA